MINYKYYAIEFCRKLQKIERTSDELSLDDIKLIRKFKTQLGYSIPESLEEGSGDKVIHSKGEELLDKLGIKTQSVTSNRDILEADNFTATLKPSKKIVIK